MDPRLTHIAQVAIHVALLLVVPFLLPGIIAKTKAAFAGRAGPPVLQLFFDVRKLLQKGAVYSRTTSWVFRAGPTVSLATALAAGCLVPLASAHAPLGFEGDVIAFAYLLALGRFFTMAAALDTGSAFEGMGASREGAFSSLAEPALMLALGIVCVPAGVASFAPAFGALPWTSWGAGHPAYLAAAVALFAVLLAESSRIPVDDPRTHLELTMIHEVMVLDHSGPDFAFVLWASAAKLFVVGSVLLHVVVPLPAAPLWLAPVLSLGGAVCLAVLIGVVESAMARLRLVRVTQFLVGASVVAAIGLVSLFYEGTR